MSVLTAPRLSKGLRIGPYRAFLNRFAFHPDAGSEESLFVEFRTGLDKRSVHRSRFEAESVKFDIADRTFQFEGNTFMEDHYPENEIVRAVKAADTNTIRAARSAKPGLKPEDWKCDCCKCDLRQPADLCGFCALDEAKPTQDLIDSGEYDHFLQEMFS